MSHQSTRSIVERIDEEVEKQSLLKHPFYQMWSKGELSLDHLAGYSEEYFSLVRAVPNLVQGTLETHSPNGPAEDTIFENLSEEKEHVELWVKFAASLGVSREKLYSHGASQKTAEAISELEDMSRSSFVESVASMYSYESELPKISRSKLDGMKKFYGLDSKDATTYFETHEVVDIKHAAVWRKILGEVPSDEQELAYSAAVRSLKAQNQILDAIMERYVS